jgi:GDPmannose 4,6-dehydratase
MNELKRRAFITGINGQDGSYLAELLLAKGYEVHGLVRRASTINTARINHLYEDPHTEDRSFFLHYGDLTDGSSLARLLHHIAPDEVYNLGAQSHVRVSFDCPEYTANVNAVGTARLLESLRESGMSPRIYQASSSEMFGGMNCPENGYDESHHFHPRSPYGCAKVFSHHLAVNYRESYDMHVSCGILFNHESPRRGETFVTRKIAKAVARIRAGLQSKVFLGNLEAKRDWGHSRDYVNAMWMMLQQDRPDDYVIATGRTHSVQEFLEEAFSYAKMGGWQDYVEFDPRYVRPAEVDVLLGNPLKAYHKLGWKPQVNFRSLVAEMVEAEIDTLDNVHSLHTL